MVFTFYIPKTSGIRKQLGCKNYPGLDSEAKICYWFAAIATGAMPRLEEPKSAKQHETLANKPIAKSNKPAKPVGTKQKPEKTIPHVSADMPKDIYIYIR